MCGSILPFSRVGVDWRGFSRGSRPLSLHSGADLQIVAIVFDGDFLACKSGGAQQPTLRAQIETGKEPFPRRRQAESYWSTLIGWRNIWSTFGPLLVHPHWMEEHLVRFWSTFGPPTLDGGTFGPLLVHFWSTHIGWRNVWSTFGPKRTQRPSCFPKK